MGSIVNTQYILSQRGLDSGRRGAPRHVPLFLQRQDPWLCVGDQAPPLFFLKSVCAPYWKMKIPGSTPVPFYHYQLKQNEKLITCLKGSTYQLWHLFDLSWLLEPNLKLDNDIVDFKMQGWFFLRVTFTKIVCGRACPNSKTWLSHYQFFAWLPTRQYTIFDRKAHNFAQIGSLLQIFVQNTSNFWIWALSSPIKIHWSPIQNFAKKHFKRQACIRIPCQYENPPILHSKRFEKPSFFHKDYTSIN